MGAQQEAIPLRTRLLSGYEDGVLGVARRMFRREVQSFEIVVVGLDLRPFPDGVSHVAEYVHDLVHRADHEVFYPAGAPEARQTDVEPIGFEARMCRGVRQPFLQFS